ncbi:hypothetical protein BC826DRAFT_975919 [Russula brevipes]|nr:hypothetical protein BC826DRAFT_975919 [Russula brevipes]
MRLQARGWGPGVVRVAMGIVIYTLHTFASVGGVGGIAARRCRIFPPCTCECEGMSALRGRRALSYTPHVFASVRGCERHSSWASSYIPPARLRAQGMLELSGHCCIPPMHLRAQGGVAVVWQQALSYTHAFGSMRGCWSPCMVLVQWWQLESAATATGTWWLVVGNDNGEREPECEDADDRLESASEKSELSWPAAGEDVTDISSNSISASESSVGGGSA